MDNFLERQITSQDVDKVTSFLKAPGMVRLFWIYVVTAWVVAVLWQLG